DVDALDVHRLELNLRRPAALRVRPPALLVEGVVTPLTAAAPIRIDAGDPPPRLAGVGEPQIALVFREADRRAVLEVGIDIALPEIGTLDDVDVAVEDLEVAVRHVDLRERIVRRARTSARRRWQGR